jgi:ribosomal protein L9
MKVTLLEKVGRKEKGTSFEVSSPTAISLIKKRVAIEFGKEVAKKAKPKKEENKAKTEE